ncbi:SPOCS domain-containing protein [Paraclostridium dentum]|uniref:SPOCS domain-containing protein n=1 Tax=Paraclostridium dentum TaxID=2662455 RepID=UPI003F354471
MNLNTHYIEYEGMNAPNCNTYELITFKEFSFSEILELPYMTCNSGQILKTSAKVDILDKKLIKTPVAQSIEGQMLTGLKIGINGEINTKITYTSDSNNQSIHVLNYKTSFYISTTIPSYIKSVESIRSNVYVENISIETYSENAICENLVLLLVLE